MSASTFLNKQIHFCNKKKMRWVLGVPGCSRGHGVCCGNKPWAERRADWEVEKEEMLLSAGGSLVWKADGLGAPSSYQYVPLWTKKDTKCNNWGFSVQYGNLYALMHKDLLFSYWLLSVSCSGGITTEKRFFHSSHIPTIPTQQVTSQQMAVELFYELPTCVYGIEKCVGLVAFMCVCVCVGGGITCHDWGRWETWGKWGQYKCHTDPVHQQNISAAQN